MKNINLKEKFRLYFHEPEGFGLRSERGTLTQTTSGGAATMIKQHFGVR